MKQKRQKLDKDLAEVVEQLGPLNVATYAFEAKERDFQRKASDIFATYMLRPYEVAKEQLQHISASEEAKKKIIAPIYDIAGRLPEEDRLIIALAMAMQDFARFSCNNGFGYFKNPTGCDNCHESEENATLMGIVQFYKPKGDRVYRIDEEELHTRLVEAITRIQDKDLVAGLLEENDQLQMQKPDMELKKRLNDQKSTLETYIQERDAAIKEAVSDTQYAVRQALRNVEKLL